MRWKITDIQRDLTALSDRPDERSAGKTPPLGQKLCGIMRFAEHYWLAYRAGSRNTFRQFRRIAEYSAKFLGSERDLRLLTG
jgi:hypothetical protein